MISSDEAKSALDYSMSRFEVHIDTDFGDGLWAEWLETNGDSDYGISGYLWSALGSPFRETRWNAVHTIYRLANFGHEEIFKYFSNGSPLKRSAHMGAKVIHFITCMQGNTF